MFPKDSRDYDRENSLPNTCRNNPEGAEEGRTDIQERTSPRQEPTVVSIISPRQEVMYFPASSRRVGSVQPEAYPPRTPVSPYVVDESVAPSWYQYPNTGSSNSFSAYSSSLPLTYPELYPPGTFLAPLPHAPRPSVRSRAIMPSETGEKNTPVETSRTDFKKRAFADISQVSRVSPPSSSLQLTQSPHGYPFESSTRTNQQPPVEFTNPRAIQGLQTDMGSLFSSSSRIASRSLHFEDTAQERVVMPFLSPQQRVGRHEQHGQQQPMRAKEEYWQYGEFNEPSRANEAHRPTRVKEELHDLGGQWVSAAQSLGFQDLTMPKTTPSERRQPQPWQWESRVEHGESVERYTEHDDFENELDPDTQGEVVLMASKQQRSGPSNSTGSLEETSPGCRWRHAESGAAEEFTQNWQSQQQDLGEVVDSLDSGRGWLPFWQRDRDGDRDRDREMDRETVRNRFFGHWSLPDSRVATFKHWDRPPPEGIVPGSQAHSQALINTSRQSFTPGRPRHPSVPSVPAQESISRPSPLLGPNPQQGTQDVTVRSSMAGPPVVAVSPSGRVKKPPNPFFLFATEFRAKLAEENPEMNNSEVSKLLGEKWKSMSSESKKPYVNRAEELRIHFKKLYPDFYSVTKKDNSKDALGEALPPWAFEIRQDVESPTRSRFTSPTARSTDRGPSQ